MSEQVKLEQAVETYQRTIKDEPRDAWDTWVIAVHNSMMMGNWISVEGLPGFAYEVYEFIKSKVNTSYSDEK